MNLHENVAKLQSVLSSLKFNDAKFASDLIASYKKYGGLTPKQAPWIEKLIARLHEGDWTDVHELFREHESELLPPPA